MDPRPRRRPELFAWVPRAVWPLLGLAAVAVITCATLVITLGGQMDASAAAEKRAMVRGALSRELIALGAGARDYGQWDDAVHHLYGDLDRGWAGSNLVGTYRVYVVDRAGHSLFARERDLTPAEPLSSAAPSVLQYLRTGLPPRSGTASSFRPLTTTGLFAGRPALFAAMPIVPATSGTKLVERLRYVVIVRPVDQSLLRGWSLAFGLPDIVVGPASGDDDPRSIAFDDPHGRPLASIGWQPVRPGRDALLRLFPVMAGLAAIFLCLGAVLAALIIRTSRALEARTRQADAAAAEAEQARAVAEEARVAAEGSLRQALAAKEELALASRRERDQQARHQHELRATSRKLADAISASVADLVSALSTRADELEQSAGRTLATVEAQRRASEAMRARAHDTATAIANIVAALNELSAASRDILRRSQAARDGIEGAKIESVATRQANHNLATQVGSIEAAARLIEGIASQTNLLALNAGIEAARAGPAGRGFAVVAGEVKALAAQTRHQTVDIHARVARVSDAAGASVTLVDSVHALLEDASLSISGAAAAVSQQEGAAALILQTSQKVAENAKVADHAASEFVCAIEPVSASARATREVGRQVRDQAGQIRAELSRLIEQLRAA